MVFRFILFMWFAWQVTAVGAQSIDLQYTPAPVDNPLKGLVPYWHQDGPFPCSMEFWYFPVNEIMHGPDKFDWSVVETKLNDIQSRGHQTVFRMYLEYPGQESGMPDYLKKLGVKITTYKHDGKINHTPDYHNPVLIKAMEDFVAAMGSKYDGDPRVGFITMGILGHWGEWHCYPREKLFATKANQTRIQDAFAKHFKATKVLMRYPAGDNAWAHAANDQHPVGYHDDSFAWATLDTGRAEDDWFFEPAMKKAGEKALNKWKTQPIGGEIRPEIWGCVFDDDSCAPKGQSFDACVQRLHVTWLMDSGMFSEAKQKPTKQRIRNATQSVQKMGYELHVSNAVVNQEDGVASVALTIENRGVAPFYYDWPVELVALDPSGNAVQAEAMDWKLSDVLPNKPAIWKGEIKLKDDSIDKFGIQVRNPMKNGKPLHFANTSQHANGILILE